jgi:hypothetical protein
MQTGMIDEWAIDSNYVANRWGESSHLHGAPCYAGRNFSKNADP